MIISKNPQFTGISARQQLEFTTHLLLTDWALICFEALADRPNRQRTPVLTYHRLKNFIQHRTSGVSHSLHGRTGTPLFSCPLLRSRGRKSLATSGFAGAYLARQGIYTLSPETALLLRNKSTAKGVIYYGSFQSGTEQGLHRNEQPPPTQQGAFPKGKGAAVAHALPARRLGLYHQRAVLYL